MVLLAMESSNTLSSSPTLAGLSGIPGLPGLPGHEGHTGLDGGNWSSVVQAKKGKGKKKLKNARTLSLQTFFSQHGGQEIDNFDDGPRDNQEGHATGNGQHETQAGKLGSINELSCDDIVLRESLFSFFADLLKRLGPVKVHSSELQAELRHVSAEGKDLIERHKDLAGFLRQSEQFAIVDDLVCTRDQVERAQTSALNTIVSAVAARNSNKQQQQSTVNANVIRPATPQTSTVWNSKSLTISKPSADVAPLLELPKVESLFSSYDPAAGSGLLSGSGPLTTFLSSRISPQRMTNGFTVTPASSLFGGLGTTSYDTSPPDPTTIEKLQRKIQNLLETNENLSSQLSDKQRTIDKLTKMINPQNEILNEKLRIELDESKKEIERLKKQLEEGDYKSDKFSSELNDTSLIVSLKSQLENERLNVRNLRHQLELEKLHTYKLSDKHNYLVNYVHSNKLPGSQGTLGVLSEPPTSNDAQDSFGLRRLLANSPPAFGLDPPGSQTRYVPQAVTPPSSSLFARTQQRPPGSYSPALQRPPPTSSPQTPPSGLGFASHFGSRSDLGTVDEFSRLGLAGQARMSVPPPPLSYGNPFIAPKK